MGSHGIRDRVAIIGMGCTPFAEHWDKGLDDLLLDATREAFAAAGLENWCATGSKALRKAAYAVASGPYDVAMAVGVEKVKDSGFQGLNAFPVPADGTQRTLTAVAMFSMVVPAYAEKYGVPKDEL